MAPPIGAGPYLKETIMLKLELGWDPLRPDLANYNNKLRAAMKRLWQNAIGEFIRTLVYEDLVKVDTGMSVASLHDAAVSARMWGEVEANIAFKRKNTHRKGLTDIRGRYHRDMFRDVKAGVAAARKATKISFDLPVMEFNFSIEVYQWAFWEGRWDSLEKGADAFIKFIDDNYAKYMPGFEELFKMR